MCACACVCVRKWENLQEEEKARENTVAISTVFFYGSGKEEEGWQGRAG